MDVTMELQDNSAGGPEHCVVVGGGTRGHVRGARVPVENLFALIYELYTSTELTAHFTQT